MKFTYQLPARFTVEYIEREAALLLFYLGGLAKKKNTPFCPKLYSRSKYDSEILDYYGIGPSKVQ